MRYRIIALSHLQRQPFNKVCNERKSALSRDKIAVIIPCYNEALTIGKVIDDFRRELVTFPVTGSRLLQKILGNRLIAVFIQNLTVFRQSLFNLT